MDQILGLCGKACLFRSNHPAAPTPRKRIAKIARRASNCWRSFFCRSPYCGRQQVHPLKAFVRGIRDEPLRGATSFDPAQPLSKGAFKFGRVAGVSLGSSWLGDALSSEEELALLSRLRCGLQMPPAVAHDRPRTSGRSPRVVCPRRFVDRLPHGWPISASNSWPWGLAMRSHSLRSAPWATLRLTKTRLRVASDHVAARG